MKKNEKSELGDTLSIIAGAIYIWMGFEWLLRGAKRRAVAQALAEREEREQRLRDLAQEAEERAERAREEFRADIAAGVRDARANP